MNWIIIAYQASAKPRAPVRGVSLGFILLTNTIIILPSVCVSWDARCLHFNIAWLQFSIGLWISW